MDLPSCRVTIGVRSRVVVLVGGTVLGGLSKISFGTLAPPTTGVVMLEMETAAPK